MFIKHVCLLNGENVRNLLSNLLANRLFCCCCFFFYILERFFFASFFLYFLFRVFCLLQLWLAFPTFRSSAKLLICLSFFRSSFFLYLFILSLIFFRSYSVCYYCFYANGCRYKNKKKKKKRNG